MGKLKDRITPDMPEVRELFPGVGKPGTPGSKGVIKVREFVRNAQPKPSKKK